jgi:TPP-dependent pyruvate/acetoin dehydrogenase alpha subunit
MANPTCHRIPDLAGKLYVGMIFVRRFLERVDTLYRQGHVRGPANLGLGQEAIAESCFVRRRSVITRRSYAGWAAWR